MSNLYGAGRSNYFRVKDEGKFVSWCSEREIHYEGISPDTGKMFAIFGDDESGGLPSEWVNDEGEEIQCDVSNEIADMLYPEHLFIWTGISGERSSVCGVAYWVNHQGEKGNIDLQEIYAMAKNHNPGSVFYPADPTVPAQLMV